MDSKCKHKKMEVVEEDYDRSIWKCEECEKEIRCDHEYSRQPDEPKECYECGYQPEADEPQPSEDR